MYTLHLISPARASLPRLPQAVGFYGGALAKSTSPLAPEYTTSVGAGLRYLVGPFAETAKTKRGGAMECWLVPIKWLQAASERRD